MKSARGRGRDRTGLASGPATSPSCWQRRGYTTGRAEPRGRQLSGRASPRVRGPAPGAQRGPAKLTALCAPARGGRSPASFPRSTSPGHPPSPYPASERAAAGPAPLPPRPPSSAPGGRRSAGPQTRALLDRVPFAVSAARGPSPGRARSRVQAQAGEQGSRRGWAEFGRRASPRAAGGEGCASAQPARLPACALQGDRPEPPASSGGPVSAGAGCAPLQPRRRSRSRRRGRGARRVRVGCWGAIGPRALLRSSASYLGKVKLLTHRKPFRPLRAFCSQA